jgi:hypothetical protein
VRKVKVQCEDFGSSVPMPSYCLRRPGVDYFTSDLHEKFFNISDTSNDIDYVYLYDERTAGATSNDVCSLRWFHLRQEFLGMLERGEELPSMAVKVLDNCTGQNKSHVTFFFDALITLLGFYQRLLNLYLFSGHSHMRPDRTVGHCRKAMKGKNIYHPSELVAAFNTVKNVRAHFITYEAAVFRDWEGTLSKYFTKLPVGFTSFFYFEVSDGRCVYKYTGDSEDSSVHAFTRNAEWARSGLLRDIFGLPPTATLADILKAPLKLPVLPPRELNEKKVESLANKYPTIPRKYQSYYPRPVGTEQSSVANDVAEIAAQVKKPVGRPPTKKEAALDRNQKRMDFFFTKAPQGAAASSSPRAGPTPPLPVAPAASCSPPAAAAPPFMPPFMPSLPVAAVGASRLPWRLPTNDQLDRAQPDRKGKGKASAPEPTRKRKKGSEVAVQPPAEVAPQPSAVAPNSGTDKLPPRRKYVKTGKYAKKKPADTEPTPPAASPAAAAPV